MATEVLGLKIGSEVASVDLSAHQYKCVLFTATGVALTAVNGKCDGVLQNKPAAGASCTVAVYGKSKVVAAAAILKGANVTVDAAGKVKTAAIGNFILGTAMEAASADGDIISVIMTRPGVSA
ncbi:DUF2190 family protein [Candidatus Babeliales bacterium]|nr:DUF2190 family protein [Candidatus Babeliales bacterium]